MHLDEESVGPGRDRGQRKGRHQRLVPRAVAWVRDYRQVRFLLQHGDRPHVQRVAVGRLKGPYPSFAEDHVRVPLQDVFGREQEFPDGVRHAPLEDDRGLDQGRLFEEVEVLHVAGADPDHVHEFRGDLYIAHVHDLGLDQHAGPLPNALQDVEAVHSESLEGIGRRARFEGRSSHDLEAQVPQHEGRGHALLLALERARPPEDHQVPAAELLASDRNSGVRLAVGLVRELVGFGESVDLLHAGLGSPEGLGLLGEIPQHVDLVPDFARMERPFEGLLLDQARQVVHVLLCCP